MKHSFLVVAVLLAASGAAAAPNVANTTQKGSLLIFPDIRIDDGWNTLVRIQNDGTLDVDIKCYWLDGNRNRLNFSGRITRTQPFWFDALTGRGTLRVNRFPITPAGGFDNPFLVGPGGVTEDTDHAGPYLKGWLVCFATGRSGQVKWNHLSGAATVYHPADGAYEYNAYAFYAPVGLDLDPVGAAGVINMNGVEYDSCPLYQIGQFTPAGVGAADAPTVVLNRLALVTCVSSTDAALQWTKLQFDVWNEDEVKFTGAFDCAGTWHETSFGADIDAAAQNFQNLGTYAARYRVQGVKSTQCEAPDRFTSAVGILAVQSTLLQPVGGVARYAGTSLTAAGKIAGRLSWSPPGPVPEGRTP